MRGLREFAYIVPFLILIFIFSYYPLYGWVYAFFDWRPPFPLTMDKFVGLKWFQSMVENDIKRRAILNVLRNTFAMSGLSLLFSWFPMIFAVFLNEIKCKPFKKFVQTVTTLPNFISWVLVYSIAYCILNSTGVLNSVLGNLGLIDPNQPILFLQSTEHVWFKQWLWLTWKNAGWSAIMYIAAITSIDEQMIEAARIDGLNEFGIFFRMFIPTMRSTFAAALTVTFMNAWNNYIWPKVIMQDSKAQTLPMMISNLTSGYFTDYGALMLAVLITTLPTAILFLALQKNFAEGITGAVK